MSAKRELIECCETDCTAMAVGQSPRCDPCRDARKALVLERYKTTPEAVANRIYQRKVAKGRRALNAKTLKEVRAMMREPKDTFTIAQLQYARVGGGPQSFEGMVNAMLERLK